MRRPFTEKFTEELKKIDDYMVQGYLRIMESVNIELKEVSRLIAQKARDNEGARLLMTIPGISYYSALLISSEIGEIGRFPDSSSLVAYAGLSPSTHSSGGATYHGPITKQGSPHPRRILNQCVRIRMKMEPDSTAGDVLAEAGQEEGGPEGHRGCVCEAAEDSLLGPERDEGISQLEGLPRCKD